jgi:GH18 family chitinase
VTPVAIDAVDAFHLMSYDGEGPHSTFEMAKSDVQRLIDQGVPQAKIRLGLPFYGRGVTNRNEVKTYAEIVAAQSRPLNLEKLNSNDFNGISFNGPAMIRSKTEWARNQKLNGVMIWEIGQDATGDDSLLKVILKTLN